VTMRARFPNPNALLLPGMFVQAVFAQAIDASAFLVPQQAVSRDPQGNATVWIVGPNNKAVQRTVKAGRAIGENWVVTGGLRPGDKVITQSTGNLRQGADLRPVPASSPEIVRPPSPEQLKQQQQQAKGKAA
jgi:membrane fusion protein, multidrug efflux system